jgi:hypothetical protein
VLFLQGQQGYTMQQDTLMKGSAYRVQKRCRMRGSTKGGLKPDGVDWLAWGTHLQLQPDQSKPRLA